MSVPDNPDPMDMALAAMRGRRAPEARRFAEIAWQQSRDSRAAAILALLELDAGRVRGALEWNDRARIGDPANPAYVVQSARLLLLLKDADGAVQLLLPAVQSHPDLRKAWSDLVDAGRRAQRTRDVIALALQVLDTRPEIADALQAILNLLPLNASATNAPPVKMDVPRRSVSVVTCSVMDDRFQRMAATYARALEGWPHEIVRISDATSLADGYARGLKRAVCDVVVFSHDDVEILSNDFPKRLLHHLSTCDVLGVAGATRATGPAWGHAGRPFLHGCVIYPNADGYRVGAYSHVAPIARGIRVMDGVVLATSRANAQRVGWDADGSMGFHGYDVDFSLRAAKLGLSLGVASDLGVVHHSMGSFGADWNVAATRLMRRHPELTGPFAADTAFVARDVKDGASAIALVDRWCWACSGNIASALA